MRGPPEYFPGGYRYRLANTRTGELYYVEDYTAVRLMYETYSLPGDVVTCVQTARVLWGPRLLAVDQ